MFQSVISWGGTVEIPDSHIAIKESYPVLEKHGFFGISGDLYKKNSKSMKVAEK